MASIRDIWLHANNIIRTSRQMVNDGLRPLGLSSAEGNVLVHLLTQQHVLRQEDIVEQLDVSKPAVSRALDSLEQKRFVLRKKDMNDKRANLVLLTPKAKQIGASVLEVYDGVFRIAMQVVSQHEMPHAIDMLARISDSFAAARQQRRQPDAE